jgi:hypothetical protein
MEVEEGYFGARSPARIGTKLCFLLQELRDLACFCSEMKMKHAHGVQGVEYDWGGGCWMLWGWGRTTRASLATWF